MDGTEKGNGIDLIAERLLPETGWGCDVGANNGLFFSNTKRFEDKGWTILCVEPNPDLVAEGRKNRKLWAPVACGSADADSVTFTRCGCYPWAGGSGFHAYTNDLEKVEYEVPMRRLDTLLLEHHFPCLDLLSIDVEWAEMEVLRGIDLREWRPKVIIAEALDQCRASELREYLKSRGYAWVTSVEYDHCFQLCA